MFVLFFCDFCCLSLPSSFLASCYSFTSCPLSSFFISTSLLPVCTFSLLVLPSPSLPAPTSSFTAVSTLYFLLPVSTLPSFSSCPHPLLHFLLLVSTIPPYFLSPSLSFLSLPFTVSPPSRHKPFQMCKNYDHQLCDDKATIGGNWFAHSIEELVIWTVQRHYGNL